MTYDNNGKLTLSNLTNIRPLTPEEEAEYEASLKEAYGDDYGKDYWDFTGVEDSSFKEVAEVVEDYLADLASQGFPPSISWAPLSDYRWELVGFHPEYGSAIVDSVYATPKVAKAIMKRYPEVDLMNLER
jgi:hypothetical protein